MGVTGDFLNRIIKTGAQELDLRAFRDHGIVDRTRTCIANTASDGSPKQKRQRSSHDEKRRPLRVGVDVGVLIARASHGFGGMLMDERHLSNMGRAMLLQHQEGGGNDGEDHDASVLLDATPAETRLEYIQKCAGYVLERIQNLQQNTGSQLLVVLDGNTPPIKKRECHDRSTRKQAAAAVRDVVVDGTLAVAESPQTQTTNRMKAAKRAGAGRCHPEIVAKVIEGLRESKTAFLVAPYEADGQLAYFSSQGMIDLVITEDSDLIAHGCRSILYKSLENNSGGKGMLVQRNYLGCREMKPKTMSLLDFSDVMLAVMFVAAGCDYCTSLKNIGSVAARDIVKDAFLGQQMGSSATTQTPALERVFARLYKHTSQKNLTKEEKETYEENFLAALIMYRHPVVYDPLQCRCVVLRRPGVDVELMDYEPYAALCMDDGRREKIVGSFYGSSVLETKIAEGWIAARSLKPHPGVPIPIGVSETLVACGLLEAIEEEDPSGEFVVEEKEEEDIAAVETQEHVGDTQEEATETQGAPTVHFETEATTGSNSQHDLSAAGSIDDEEFETQGATPLRLLRDTGEKVAETQGAPTVHFETQATAPGTSQQDLSVVESSDGEAFATQGVTPLRPLRDATQEAEQSENTIVPPTASTSSASKPATQPSQPSIGSQLSDDVRSPALL